MRIVASLPRYPPTSLVGAWLTTHELLRHLVTRGHDVTVAAGGVERGYSLDGVAVVPQPEDLGELVEEADVVVTHLGDGDRGAFHARRHRRPLVRMVHGVTGDEVERLERYRTALAVFSSRTAAEEVGWSGPSVVVRPAIDLEAHRVENRESRFCVALVNLSALKGGALFWRLAEAMPDVSFLGVLGAWGAQLEGDLPNVKVVPPTRQMARDVWSRTRVLLMPSERETFGRVALEAAASGIPTVASREATGVAEAIPTGLITVARDDFGSWEGAIRALLERPAAYRLASSMAADVAARYRPDLEMARFAAAIEVLVPARMTA